MVINKSNNIKVRHICKRNKITSMETAVEYFAIFGGLDVESL